MNPFSLGHINETEFEQFCYDLLKAKGFQNLNWRKGTGLDASPSDRGRDIECKMEHVDIDRRKYLETWFVQCKHYKKGIPPSKLQGILTWASAENPDVVLIVASNFLSNPAKDYLETYQRKNKPRFRIKIWEKPDLEKLTFGESRLLKKYKISVEFPFLSILHPAHLFYIRHPQFNSLDYFFRILDGIDSTKRDNILSWSYYSIIRPRYQEPVSGNETLNDLRIDELSYKIFKKKCYEIAKIDLIDQYLLVFLIVNFVLQWQMAISDTTSVDENIHWMKRAINFFQVKIKEKPQERDLLENIIEDTEERIVNAQENIEQNYKLYEYFCDKVLRVLLLEDIYAKAQRVDKSD